MATLAPPRVTAMRSGIVRELPVSVMVLVLIAGNIRGARSRERRTGKREKGKGKGERGKGKSIRAKSFEISSLSYRQVSICLQ